MKPRLALSAGFALATHVALVLCLTQSLPRHGGDSEHRAIEVVSLRAATPAPLPTPTAAEVAPVEPEPEAVARETAAIAPGSGKTSAAPSPDRFEPSLAPDGAAIRTPDAPMPPDGVELRVYLRLDDQGQPAAAEFTAPPGTPAAFQKLADLGLRQGRLRVPHGAVGQAGLAYCLRLRFKPDVEEAELAWLPGIADSSQRCLQGSAPQVQLLQ